ncbi:MAG TPA: ATP-dependent DNA helicase [Clostridia bacterium]|nr:ATP-dependent DNA helicase [Clostridia bacterium]
MTCGVDSKPIISVSVRQLADSTRRQGGLAGPFYAGITGIEGTKIHSDFANYADGDFPDHQLFPEVTLQTHVPGESIPFDLKIQGRCDMVTISPEKRVTLIEVKGFRGDTGSIPHEGDPVHLAQALIYAHMLFESEFFRSRALAVNQIDVQVRYIALDSGESKTVRNIWTREALKNNFSKICTSFAKTMAPLLKHRLIRDESNQKASFPYEQLRDGQRQMMQEVIATVRDKTVLFVQAPTGIGKTMATLYPAIKAQANGLTDQIFYLTPTRSQRKIAESTLDDLESRAFYIRSLTLRAKEQLCLSPAHFCDIRQCPYAVRYYEGLRDALEKSYQYRRLMPEDVQTLAKEYGLCPFEFSLALIPTVDVVICDYNYIFNPRVRFQDWLDDPKQRYTLLVDEAHNLARRSREMFSAVLTMSGLFALREGLAKRHPESGQERRIQEAACLAADRLIHTLNRFRDLLLANERQNQDSALYDELKAYHPVRDNQFLATKSLPPWLLKEVSALTGILTGYFTGHPKFPGRQAMMIPYFDLLYFLRVSERYYDDSYITTWRTGGKNEVYMTLLALDASTHLTDIYRDRSPVVFFSATLSPLPYYLSLLDARSTVERPELVNLPSPFPKERRLVICYEAHSLRYNDRSQSIDSIARLIRDVATLRKGHYLVFSPSFSYQRQLVRALSDLKIRDIDFLVQPTRMTDTQKNDFLARFSKVEDKKPLVGLTVIGSLFNEGVDLVGEALTGVVVIGTGIPGISPERDILRQYYDAKTGNGFEFAYVWPGFNRVAQAAGRLIRSDNDFGIVVLIDDRYARSDYQKLIPEEWNSRHIDDRDECLRVIESFWKDYD